MVTPSDGEITAEEAKRRAESVVGVGEGVAGILALGAIFGGGALDFARDLRGSLVRIFSGGGLEAALREERARNKATVLALAAIADGMIAATERPVVDDFARRHGFDPIEVDAQISSLSRKLREPGALREKVAQCAKGLDADERLELFVAVKNLAHRDSRAWSEQQGYRVDARPTPEALISTFREGLGIATADAG